MNPDLKNSLTFKDSQEFTNYITNHTAFDCTAFSWCPDVSKKIQEVVNVLVKNHFDWSNSVECFNAKSRSCWVENPLNSPLGVLDCAGISEITLYKNRGVFRANDPEVEVHVSSDMNLFSDIENLNFLENAIIWVRKCLNKDAFGACISGRVYALGCNQVGCKETETRMTSSNNEVSEQAFPLEGKVSLFDSKFFENASPPSTERWIETCSSDSGNSLIQEKNDEISGRNGVVIGLLIGAVAIGAFAAYKLMYSKKSSQSTKEV